MSDKLVDRIGLLLAKGEDAGATEQERETYLAKAQQLAAAASIDLALARARQADKTKREVPETRGIRVGREGATGNRWRVSLLCDIAEVNYCRCVMSKTYVWPTGFPTDIEVAERLYSHLVVQMVAAADAALARGEQRTAGWYDEPVDGRVFRSNFYEAWIRRVISRLWDARYEAEAAREQAAADGSTGVALVLASKTDEVNATYDALVAKQRIRGTYKAPEASTHASGAYRAGQNAGARASLGLDDGRTVDGATARQAIGSDRTAT